MSKKLAGLLAALATLAIASPQPVDDESVFVKGLKAGERESLLYVWTRDGDGQESDFVAVVDVNPDSPEYGKIITTSPTGSAADEAHHFGYTVNADRIFAGGMFTNKLFIYDLAENPKEPKLINTIDLDPTGYSGPHTFYAIPGGVMIAMLGSVDGGTPGGLVYLDDDGNLIESYPSERDGPPVYMYDVGVKLEMNRMITSSWAPPEHIMHELAPPELVGDEAVVWDWETKKPLQVVHLDKAPLEVRWMHGPQGLGGFVNCAYGGTVWYWEDADDDGTLEFERVIELPEGSIPADMRISYDNNLLYVSLWGGGEVRQYNITDPHHPKLVDSVQVPQPNMMKLTPDSERLYVTNSLLSPLDGDVEFGAWLFHVGPDGMELEPTFEPDFNSFENGPAGPHDMLLK